MRLEAILPPALAPPPRPPLRFSRPPRIDCPIGGDLVTCPVSTTRGRALR
jgi:hypothetical protein